MNSEILVKSATRYIFSNDKFSPSSKEPTTMIPEIIEYQFVL